MVKKALRMMSRLTGYLGNLSSKDNLRPVFCLHARPKFFVFQKECL